MAPLAAQASVTVTLTVSTATTAATAYKGNSTSGAASTSAPGVGVTTLSASVSGGSATWPGIIQFCDNSDNVTCRDNSYLGTAVIQTTGARNAGYAVLNVRLVALAGGTSHNIFARLLPNTTIGNTSLVYSAITTVAQTAFTAASQLTQTGAAGNYNFTNKVLAGPTGGLSTGGNISHAAPAPTGSVTFTDTTNSTTLGSADLGASVAPYQTLVDTMWSNGLPGASSDFEGSKLIVTGDFNNDGIPDVVLFGIKQYAVLLGNGDGTFHSPGLTYFNPALSYVVGNTFTSATVGDMDADGNLDIIASAASNVYYLKGNGDGTFVYTPSSATTAIPGCTGTDGTAVGDFNSDGYLDFAVGCTLASNAGEVAIFEGEITSGVFGVNTSGTNTAFTATALPLPPTNQTFSYTSTTGGLVEGLQVADLNGDGAMDLIVSTLQPATPFAIINPYLNTIHGFPMTTGTTISNVAGASFTIANMAVGDLAGNGVPYLALSTSNNMFVYPVASQTAAVPPSTPGAITWGTGIDYPWTPASFSSGIAIGDFNGDGYPDVAIGCSSTCLDLYVFLNQGAPNTATVTAVTDTAATASITAVSITTNVVTFTVANSYTVGTVVTVSGYTAGGCTTAPNGTLTVTGSTPTTFTASFTDATCTPGGTGTASVNTVTFTATNTFAVGNTVTVSGLTGASCGTGFNTYFTLSAVTSSSFSANTSVATCSSTGQSGAATTAGTLYLPTTASTFTTVGGAPYGIAVADFAATGSADIATANYTTFPLIGVTASGTTATFTTNASHDLVVGQYVDLLSTNGSNYPVTGVSACMISVLNNLMGGSLQNNYNYQITAVPNVTSFTLTLPSTITTCSGYESNSTPDVVTVEVSANMDLLMTGQTASASISGISVPSSGTQGVEATVAPTGYYLSTSNTLSLNGGMFTLTAGSPNQSGAAYGTSVTLTATISTQSSTYYPSGTVQFYADGVALGTAQTFSGSSLAVSLVTTAIPTGHVELYAVYAGDTHYGAATTPDLDYTVTSGSTASTLTYIQPPYSFVMAAGSTAGVVTLVVEDASGNVVLPTTGQSITLTASSNRAAPSDYPTGTPLAMVATAGTPGSGSTNSYPWTATWNTSTGIATFDLSQVVLNSGTATTYSYTVTNSLGLNNPGVVTLSLNSAPFFVVNAYTDNTPTAVQGTPLLTATIVSGAVTQISATGSSDTSVTGTSATFGAAWGTNYSSSYPVIIYVNDTSNVGNGAYAIATISGGQIVGYTGLVGGSGYTAGSVSLNCPNMQYYTGSPITGAAAWATTTGVSCQLRDAIQNTNAGLTATGESVVFSNGPTTSNPTGTPQTITLGATMSQPAHSSQYYGPGPALLTINGTNTTNQASYECLSASSTSFTIQGMTIANCYSSGSGGGMSISGSSGVVLDNMQFVNNYAEVLGGGIVFAGGGTMFVSNSTFSGNGAGTAAGVYVTGITATGSSAATLTLSGYFHISNTATVTLDGFTGCAASLNNTTTTAVTAPAFGATSLSVTLPYNLNCTLTGMQANIYVNNSAGGAIATTNSNSGGQANLHLLNDTFLNNWASAGGAVDIAEGLYNGAVSTIANSTFYGNQASKYGGAVQTYVPTVFTNDTIANSYETFTSDCDAAVGLASAGTGWLNTDTFYNTVFAGNATAATSAAASPDVCITTSDPTDNVVVFNSTDYGTVAGLVAALPTLASAGLATPTYNGGTINDSVTKSPAIAVTNVGVASGVATFTTTSAHQYQPNELVNVSGTSSTCASSFIGGTNGQYLTVATVPSTTTFTVSTSVANCSTSSESGVNVYMQAAPQTMAILPGSVLAGKGTHAPQSGVSVTNINAVPSVGIASATLTGAAMLTATPTVTVTAGSPNTVQFSTNANTFTTTDTADTVSAVSVAAGDSAMTITGVSWSSLVATFTTSAANTIVPGNSVTTSGMTVGSCGSGSNNTFLVTAVGTNTFTGTGPATAGTTCSGQTGTGVGPKKVSFTVTNTNLAVGNIVTISGLSTGSCGTNANGTYILTAATTSSVTAQQYGTVTAGGCTSQTGTLVNLGSTAYISGLTTPCGRQFNGQTLTSNSSTTSAHFNANTTVGACTGTENATGSAPIIGGVSSFTPIGLSTSTYFANQVLWITGLTTANGLLLNNHQVTVVNPTASGFVGYSPIAATAISAETGTNSAFGDIAFTTTGSNPFTAGSPVYITGLRGTCGATYTNRYYLLDYVSGNVLHAPQMSGATPVGACTNGYEAGASTGTVTGVTVSGTGPYTYTYADTTAGFLVGQSVTVSGLTGVCTAANGTFAVTAVTANTSFAVSSASSSTTCTGQTATVTGIAQNLVNYADASPVEDERGYQRQPGYGDMGALESNLGLSFTAVTNQVVGTPLTSGITLSLTDNGNPLPNVSSVPLVAELSSGTVTGTGTITSNAAGVATLSGLTPETPETGVTLTVNAGPGAVSATSGSFNITAGSTTKQFTVIAPTNFDPGVPFTVTVKATDQGGDVVTSYSGTVAITSSDPSASLPANATLTSGVGTFTVTLNTPGTQVVFATDTVSSSITGASSGITSQTITFPSPASPVQFDVTGPITLTATSNFGLTITYTVTSGPATVSGSTLIITGPGTVVVTASQAGGSGYPAATSVAKTIVSTPATFAQTPGVASPATTASVTVTLTFGTATTLNSTTPITVSTLPSGTAFTNAGTGTCAASQVIAANGTCTVVLTYKPAGAGVITGLVEAFDNSGTPGLLQAAGTAAAVR